MVTVNEALKLLEAGFSVEDIRAMESAKPQPEPKAEPKAEPKTEPKAEPKAEVKEDPRIEALTSTVEKLVDVVGKMPFFASMGEINADKDADAVLASIINPPMKE